MNEQWICPNRSQLWINGFPNLNYLKIGAKINIAKFGLNNCTFTIAIIGTKLAIPWHMRTTISLLVSITNYFSPFMDCNVEGESLNLVKFLSMYVLTIESEWTIKKFWNLNFMKLIVEIWSSHPPHDLGP